MTQQRPLTKQDVITVARRMAGNPADSVTLASQLAEMIRALPPDSAEVLSRQVFDRASLWTLGVSFENVDPSGGEVPPQEIRIPHDMWIRGVVGQAYLKLGSTDSDSGDIFEKVEALALVRNTIGTNGRGFFESNWRLDGKQGFISSGQSEILAPASVIMGDGFFVADMDWQLQKNQVIEVRLRSRVNALFPPNMETSFSAEEKILRWVTVNFWCEELDQP
jgi:hypothetical protein